MEVGMPLDTPAIKTEKCLVGHHVSKSNEAFSCGSSLPSCRHVCRCSCHNGPVEAMHGVPCCVWCKQHGNIGSLLWDAHIKQCHSTKATSSVASLLEE